MRHPLTELFHLSNLFQMSNDCRMVNTDFFSNFLSSSKGSALMIALNWSLSTFDSQPIHSSSSRLSSPLQNFLNHDCTVHSLAVPGPNVLLILQVNLHCFTTHFELKLKNFSKLVFVYLSSIV